MKLMLVRRSFFQCKWSVTACQADGYCPSDELLATFATLPAQFLNQGGNDQKAKSFKQEESSKHIRR
jgi:hypothetical protein